jgi:hypothetical protein
MTISVAEAESDKLEIPTIVAIAISSLKAILNAPAVTQT